jgi:lipopolysaccharide export system protein LptC
LARGINERFGGWFPLVLLAVLAALTFWLDHVVQPPVPRPEAPPNEPDYFVEGLSAMRMDRSGHVKHTLEAQRMTHFPQDDLTVLVAPRFVAYGEGHVPVTITSKHARMSGNGEDVYFEDDVRVVRAPEGRLSELVLETSYLHVIPDDNIAKTDKPVTIRDATAVVVASGLELNSETRVLELQGRVRGTFEPSGVQSER